MSKKSVLVINTPSDCKECDCHLWLVCVPKDEDLEPDENGRYSIPERQSMFTKTHMRQVGTIV